MQLWTTTKILGKNAECSHINTKKEAETLSTSAMLYITLSLIQ